MSEINLFYNLRELNVKVSSVKVSVLCSQCELNMLYIGPILNIFRERGDWDNYKIYDLTVRIIL